MLGEGKAMKAQERNIIQASRYKHVGKSYEKGQKAVNITSSYYSLSILTRMFGNMFKGEQPRKSI